jgi:geranylgeranyl diphosphate synthase type II
MHSFEELSKKFSAYFDKRHFPEQPASLYDPNQYFLELGGKRVRPVLCLMGNELFGDIVPDAYDVATAIELFHNFSLIHDDMMDNAPLRRGQPTIHEKYGFTTALLGGDVMLVVAYDNLNLIDTRFLHRIIRLFNQTAREVCEGQQLDMEYEKLESVTMEAYLQMIELKTSVLLAASLKMGAILGGGSENNQRHIYGFGKNLGIAFQIQDDYLDAFGDPLKFGKQPGGDIMSNKKTFLLINALETCNEQHKKELLQLMKENPPEKVEKITAIFRACGVDKWATELKDRYLAMAIEHLEAIAVISGRKDPLRELAHFLIQREY